MTEMAKKENFSLHSTSLSRSAKSITCNFESNSIAQEK